MKWWAVIEEQQKLFRLANRLEHKWRMVEEYMVDNLAKNSEDEKELKKPMLLDVWRCITTRVCASTTVSVRWF